MKNKLQNFWYYHKIPVIIIMVLLAVGAYFFLTQRSTIKSDYDIAIISPKGCSGEQLAKITKVFEQAGQDQNGDGTAAVNVRVFRFAIGEDGQDPKEIAGLDADLVGKVSGFFFTDAPERFEQVTNGIVKAADAIPVSSIQPLAGCGIDDLYLLIRSGADQKYSALLSALTE